MSNLGMDMIIGFGYLLIPGFLALSLLLLRNCNQARPEMVKAERCWRSRTKRD